MSPDEIHDMGTLELEKLQAWMDVILKQVGYVERMRGIAEDPKYQFADGNPGHAEVMVFVHDKLKWIRVQMPRAFHTLVNPNMEVQRLLPAEDRERRPHPGSRSRSTLRFQRASGAVTDL
jgi:uncharacterized protein (DUF885 family)